MESWIWLVNHSEIKQISTWNELKDPIQVKNQEDQVAAA